MKLLRTLFAGAVAAAVAAGCGDSATGSNGVTIADLVGEWNATKFEYTNQANASQVVDLMQFGAALNITVAGTGAFAGTFRETAVSPTDNITGTIEISGSTMTLTFTAPPEFVGDPISGSFDLAGDVLTLNATSGVDFDFSVIGGDPGDVPADLELVMQRQ
jgi:hypothetical protein